MANIAEVELETLIRVEDLVNATDGGKGIFQILATARLPLRGRAKSST